MTMPVIVEIVDKTDKRADGPDIQSAVRAAIDGGLTLAGASINVYAALTVETIDLSPYTMPRLAQLGFTLLRLRPPLSSAPSALKSSAGADHA
jgi:hypothetical protein